MNKMILLALAALMLLSAVTACRMPEKKDPFKEILEGNPDMELPKSEVMEIDPEDAPKYEINDVVDGYEGTEIIPLPAVGDYAAGELVVGGARIEAGNVGGGIGCGVRRAGHGFGAGDLCRGKRHGD